MLRTSALLRTIAPGCAAILVALSTAPVGATVINFESGFTDQQAVGTVNAGGVNVSFSCGADPGSAGSCFAVRYGGPTTAFVHHDTPEVGAGNGPTGWFGLSDENDGPSDTDTFFLVFDQEVSDLSLLLIDYRVDGGPTVGAEATLVVFANADFTDPLGSDTFVIPDQNPPDGNIEELSVMASGILSAMIVFSEDDVGVAIDNIAFSVAEPASLLALGFGLAGLGYLLRRPAGA